MEGPDALDGVVAQLEGFEAPAGAWESEILPARLADYEPAWLDDLCLAGRVAWARLRPRAGGPGGHGAGAGAHHADHAAAARATRPLWIALLAGSRRPAARARARTAVARLIRANGASFFDEIAEGAGLLRPQVEEALAELVALGLVTSDSFAGLRALLVPSDRAQADRVGAQRRRHVCASAWRMRAAGRWSRRAPAQRQRDARDADAVEHVARALLRRYGVVFWRLLEREARWLPPWRDLLRVYRRLEARGEIRGGRFVAGFSGEQFALPEAIGVLRETRRKPRQRRTLVSLSGADPLNLVGILTPGPKLPALTGNRVLYRDGLPVAHACGRRGAVHGNAGCRQRMGGAQDAAARECSVTVDYSATLLRSGNEGASWRRPCAMFPERARCWSIFRKL